VFVCDYEVYRLVATHAYSNRLIVWLNHCDETPYRLLFKKYQRDARVTFSPRVYVSLHSNDSTFVVAARSENRNANMHCATLLPTC
jgi:hypothetical protein